MLKHKIPQLVLGENILRIAVEYRRETELEDIYLVGKFGVSPDRRITVFPERLHYGDWTFQGLYHYPGSIRYHYALPPLDREWDGRGLRMKLGAFSGTLAVIRINRGRPFYAFRGDSRLDVTGLFRKDGENEVEIEIVGNLRNLMGPFHRSYSSCSRISWEDFRRDGRLYTSGYSVQPIGLFGEVAVVACE